MHDGETAQRNAEKEGKETTLQTYLNSLMRSVYYKHLNLLLQISESKF